MTATYIILNAISLAIAMLGGIASGDIQGMFGLAIGGFVMVNIIFAIIWAINWLLVTSAKQRAEAERKDN